MPLARATFGVMLKFSEEIKTFNQLIEDVFAENKKLSQSDQNKIATITTQLRENGNENFATLMKKWEQASQMR